MPFFVSPDMLRPGGLLLSAADLTVKVAVLVGFAGVAALSLRRAAAATRHLIWLCALAATVLLPALSKVVPSSLTTYWRAPALSTTGLTADFRPAHAELAPTTPESGRVKTPTLREETTPVSGQTGNRHSTPASAVYLAAVIGGVYMYGVLFVLSQVAFGLLGVRRLSRESLTALPLSRAASTLAELCSQLGIQPRIALRFHEHAIPMTWGWRLPVILLPSDAEEWDDERLRVVLLHELAHISRHDWLTQILTHFVCAAYCFHPLVWWAASRLRAESEQACDDRVLLNGVSSDIYARHLLEIAKLSSASARTTGIRFAAPMAVRIGLESRLRAILEAEPRREQAGRAWNCAIICAAALAVLALTFVRSREAAAQEVPPSQPPSEGQPSPSVTRESVQTGYTRHFPGGASATLVEVATQSGVKDYGANSRPILWKPEGTLIAKSALDAKEPFQTFERMLQQAPLTDHKYRFTFSFAGLTSDQVPKIMPANGKTFDQSLFSAKSEGQFMAVYMCDEPKGRHEESFTIGMPDAKWTTAARVALSKVPVAAGPMDNSLRGLVGGHVPPHFVRVYRSGSHKLSLDVLFGLSNPVDADGIERKISLLDRNGNVLETTITMKSSGTNYVLQAAYYSESVTRRAASVLVETRASTIETISHVALSPKGVIQ